CQSPAIRQGQQQAFSRKIAGATPATPGKEIPQGL
ncbi:MAG: hypothetical protein ACJAWY_003094, partial [Sphingomonas echinoides]